MSISSPLRKPHRNTRAIRGIFNKNYRSEIYDKLVGDVKLEVELILVSKLFNNSTNISDTLKLFIRSRIEDLRPNFYYIVMNRHSWALLLLQIFRFQ